MQDRDDAIQVTSHKYGRPTNPAPSIKMAGKWDTTFRTTFTKEDAHGKNPYQCASEAKTVKTTGYDKGFMLFDGNGWTPTKNLGSDQVRTEYRIRFNTEKKP